MRKRAFSLIEMVVVLGLLSLMATTLFFWHSSVSKRNAQFRELRVDLLEEHSVYQRLHTHLSKADLPLASLEGGIAFLFDGGPSQQTELSGQVLGRLYHNAAEKTLSLGVWPRLHTGLREPNMSYVLMDNVLTCTFSFYHPPDPFKKRVDPEEVGKERPQEGWQPTWKLAYQTIPSMIKMTITRPRKKGEARTIEYTFDLPITILYPMPQIV